jgi:hypothetical protein
VDRSCKNPLPEKDFRSIVKRCILLYCEQITIENDPIHKFYVAEAVFLLWPNISSAGSRAFIINFATTSSGENSGLISNDFFSGFVSRRTIHETIVRLMSSEGINAAVYDNRS